MGVGGRGWRQKACRVWAGACDEGEEAWRVWVGAGWRWEGALDVNGSGLEVGSAAGICGWSE
ncbi:hypothetical protein GCM10009733_027410 [Nonomuraea maheshkhaliensis]|uniref:Phosphotransferase n=1 Tax=Nonomuraea maheshkhaliensis TaxID=419590 RepID=A0ABP4R5R9_9ACTN